MIAPLRRFWDRYVLGRYSPEEQAVLDGLDRVVAEHAELRVRVAEVESERDHERDRANTLEAERVEWQNERRRLSAELVRLRGLRDRLLGHVRGAVDGLDSIVSAAEVAAGNEPTIPANEPPLSGSFEPPPTPKEWADHHAAVVRRLREAGVFDFAAPEREGATADVPTATLTEFGRRDGVEIPLEPEGTRCP